MPRDEFAQRVRSMITSQVFASIGRPDLRMEGPTSWGVWLRVFHAGPSGGANRRPRVRCGVLYHVAQMSLFFHGDEQAVREQLLPLFEHCTYTSLDALPQRVPVVSPGAMPAFQSSAMAEGNPESPVSHQTLAPTAPSQSSVPIAPTCLDGPSEHDGVVSGNLALLSSLQHLIEQLIHGQTSLQQSLSLVSNRVEALWSHHSGPAVLCSPPGLTSTFDRQVRETSPVNTHAGAQLPDVPAGPSNCGREGCNGTVAATCSTGCCTVHCEGRCCGCRNGVSGQGGLQVAPHEVSAERPSGPSSSSGANLPGTLPVLPLPPVHHTRPGSRTHRMHANSTVAGHQGIRVCRHVPCRNSVADCCRTGFCSRHCSSQRCPCNVPLVEADAAPPVCRRRDCTGPVAEGCSAGFCPFHCRSPRCACRVGTSSPALIMVARGSNCGNAAANRTSSVNAVSTPPPEQRVCRLFACRAVVVDTCRTGYCRDHCNSRRCPCNSARRAAPAAGLRTCRRVGCHAEVAGSCRTGFCPDHCFSRRCSCGGRTANDAPGNLPQRGWAFLCLGLLPTALPQSDL